MGIFWLKSTRTYSAYGPVAQGAQPVAILDPHAGQKAHVSRPGSQKMPHPIPLRCQTQHLMHGQ
eukprot:6153466-Karenia_brevis.AAC.1